MLPVPSYGEVIEASLRGSGARVRRSTGPSGATLVHLDRPGEIEVRVRLGPRTTLAAVQVLPAATVEALAAEGIRALAAGLPLVAQNPTDAVGREQSLYGAYLAAVAFASAGSGMHHKICHVLGGTYNLPHAQTHATVLPYVLAFNAPFAPEADARIAGAFGSASGLEGLNELRRVLNAPQALKDYGFTEADIPEAVSIALPFIPADNPRPVTTENLTELLHAAWAGSTPQSH
jgi:maleylacetate reductase